jgi:hypothetical protein
MARIFAGAATAGPAALAAYGIGLYSFGFGMIGIALTYGATVPAGVVPFVATSAVALGLGSTGTAAHAISKSGSDQVESLELTISGLGNAPDHLGPVSDAQINDRVTEILERYHASHVKIGAKEQQEMKELHAKSLLLHLGWTGVAEIKAQCLAESAHASLYDLETASLLEAREAVAGACQNPGVRPMTADLADSKAIQRDFSSTMASKPYGSATLSSVR